MNTTYQDSALLMIPEGAIVDGKYRVVTFNGNRYYVIDYIENGTYKWVKRHEKTTNALSTTAFLLGTSLYLLALDILKPPDSRVLTSLASKYGRTPLHHATIRGDVAEVRRLLAAGVNVNAQDRNGWSALHQAAQEGHVEVVQLLLDKGADVGAKTSENYTPLHWAAIMRHQEVVRLLLAAGADPHAKDSRGITPWKVASPAVRAVMKSCGVRSKKVSNCVLQ